MDSYIDAWEGVMRGYRIRLSWLPLLLAAGLTACASNGVQPGIVYTSSASPPAGGQGYPYPATGPAQANGPVQASAPAQGNNPYPAPGVSGDAGRVVSIREVGLAGGGGGGGIGGNGPLLGGILGAGAGATIGAITSQTLGGGIVGAVIGLVGGAIAGSIASGNYGSGGPGGGYGGRGIEVTVQRDDGQQITVAQRDDGDIQLGDRVQVVQNGRGVAQVVRDTSRAPD
jgi:outer membrane lipoprotein SlyB